MLDRDAHASLLIRDYFNLPRRHALMASLTDRGLGQADLVLCLLRIRDATRNPDRRRLLAFYVHRLVGRPILVGEPCLLRYRANGARPRTTHPRDPRDRKITWVLGTNPRQPQTDAYLRWSEFKVGRTVGQLRIRGVTRRDIRRAVRRNWIRMEEIAA
jgi:hypothetical protein